MNTKQSKLFQLMSDISEWCYCAGWMHGNEYVLWEMVSDPNASRRYGQDIVDEEDIDALRVFSSDIKGWIRWRDDEEDSTLPAEEWGPAFTPMEEWLEMYARWAGASSD